MIQHVSIIEITIECDLEKTESTNGELYKIKWIGGEDRHFTTPTFRFAVQSMPEAFNKVAVLSALNPCIKNISIKKS